MIRLPEMYFTLRLDAVCMNRIWLYSTEPYFYSVLNVLNNLKLTEEIKEKNYKLA